MEDLELNQKQMLEVLEVQDFMKEMLTGSPQEIAVREKLDQQDCSLDRLELALLIKDLQLCSQEEQFAAAMELEHYREQAEKQELQLLILVHRYKSYRQRPLLLLDKY